MRKFVLVVKERKGCKSEKNRLLVDETDKEIKDRLGDLAYMYVKPKKQSNKLVPTEKSIEPAKIKENKMYQLSKEELASRNRVKLDDILKSSDIVEYSKMREFIESYGPEELEKIMVNTNFWSWFYDRLADIH